MTMQQNAFNGLERWVAGLRVGLAAHRLCQPLKGGDRVFRNKLRDALVTELDAMEARSNDPKTKNAILKSLPIQALEALANPELIQHLSGDESNLEIESPHWKLALASVVTSQREGRPPLVNSSSLLANLILDGHCSPHFLMQCGRVFVSDRWKLLEREVGWKEAAAEPLARMRSKTSYNGEAVDTFDRVEGLDAFRSAFPIGLANWTLIENAVYHHLFVWPLLVFKGGAGAFSIPVAVDILFDGKDKVTLIGAAEGSNIDVSSWRPELELASKVAKDLWRSKHGGIAFSFKEIVLNSSVKVDFRIAEKVLDFMPFGLELVDKSMGAYFAEIILHRLLGRTAGLGSVVTGSIGSRRRWSDGSLALDYEMLPAKWLSKKIEYVFRTRLFSKLVLAGTDEETSETTDAMVESYARHEEHPNQPITEINYCPYISNVSDSVQVSGWRQHSYVRCPDVMHAIHHRGSGLLPFTNEEVNEIGRVFLQGDDPVKKLPEHLSIQALVSYLRWINFAKREEIRPNTPPMLSWAFLRAVSDENDRRLWQTIWRLIGASTQDFALFRHSNTSAAAAKLFADAFNTFSPRESCPSHRAPDLLIVFCTSKLNPADWKKGSLSYRSHIFPSVISALAQTTLRPSPNEQMREFIGNTRMLLVEQGDYDVGGEHPPSTTHLDPESRQILDCLSTFRFGFSQQMASILLSELNHSGGEVRRCLKHFSKQGYLGEVGGEYWVRGNVGSQPHGEPKRRLLVAKRHWAAAKAFGPYLLSARMPGLDFPKSFLPEFVHETAFHLEIAATAAMREYFGQQNKRSPIAVEANELRKTIRIAQARVLRFLELPSLGTLRNLTKDRNGLPSRAAADMAIELREEKEKLGLAATGAELAGYAGAFTSWLEDVIRTSGPDEQRSTLSARALELYQEALKLLNSHQSPEELELRLSVLTNVGYFVAKFRESTADGKEQLNGIRNQIADLIWSGVETPAIEAKWFEIEGDRHERADEAAIQYGIATRLTPQYSTCWIKFAGARAEHGGSISAALSHVSNMPFNMRHNWHQWATNQALPLKSGLDRPWIVGRWRAGVQVLESLVNAAA